MQTMSLPFEADDSAVSAEFILNFGADPKPDIPEVNAAIYKILLTVLKKKNTLLFMNVTVFVTVNICHRTELQCICDHGT